MDKKYIIEDLLLQKLNDIVWKIYSKEVIFTEILPTPDFFEGDFTVNTFTIGKQLRLNPLEIALKINSSIKPDELIQKVEVQKAYLNLTLQDDYWISILNQIIQHKNYGICETGSMNKTVMIEFSSPNTNKPLHLGHIRNNLIGHSVSELYKAMGYNVIKANLINDRGIHICKSMLAWQKWGNGEKPKNSGIKGDHLVGKYYVLFDKEYKRQIKELILAGISESEAEKIVPIILEAQAMLKKWEDGDPEVLMLWNQMNDWVYDGFDKTYSDLGISFDLMEYESDTYKLGKEVVYKNYEKGLVEKEPDESLWVDFTSEGLDRKLLLRGDGTSVYITQDIGTAIRRKEKYDIDKIIYVVAVEQQYHFKVLRLLLKHFGFDWYDDIVHLSYEMVSLPSGRMKSREGTVVDADDLIQEMTNQALSLLKMREGDAEIQLAKTIGLGSLKYHIIKVDPQKNILFDPAKTIDFQGNSGAFIQYSHARIKSILRSAESNHQFSSNNAVYNLNMEEKKLIMHIYVFKSIVKQAAINFNPSIVAIYLFELAQKFNQFYHLHKINTSNVEKKNFRLQLSSTVAKILKEGSRLLGIELPEKM